MKSWKTSRSVGLCILIGLFPKFQYRGKSQEGALLPGCKILLLPTWVNPDQSILNQLFPNCLHTGRRDSCLIPYMSESRRGRGFPGSILPLSCVGNYCFEIDVLPGDETTNIADIEVTDNF